MEWIPVNKRLPEHDDMVLCYLMNTDEETGCLDITNYDGDDWWNVGDFVVSHWMPLPEPPMDNQ